MPEAKVATERDRAGVYAAYYIADLTKPSEELLEELREWSFDCITTVAALGFGDIPPEAFITGFNLVRDGGWVCFNIRDTFLNESDTSGFSMLIRAMMQTQALSGRLDEEAMRRLNHAVDGDGRAPIEVAREFLAAQGLI